MSTSYDGSYGENMMFIHDLAIRLSKDGGIPWDNMFLLKMAIWEGNMIIKYH